MASPLIIMKKIGFFSKLFTYMNTLKRTSQKGTLDEEMIFAQIDSLLLASCEQYEASFQNKFAMKGMSAQRLASAFPYEEKIRIKLIFSENSSIKEQAKEVVDILYKNIHDINLRSFLDCTDVLVEHITRNNLKELDCKYLFFYDETNNNRKFRLKDGGFNVSDHQNFILGGILYNEQEFDGNIDSLFTNLNLQPTVKELKAKLILSPDFLESLKSKKLTIFLNWILEEKLYIHYGNVDILYCLALELVQQFIDEDSTQHRGESVTFGEFFYKAIKKDTSGISNLLYRYRYPNIKEEQISAFWGDCLTWFNKHESSSDIISKVM